MDYRPSILQKAQRELKSRQLLLTCEEEQSSQSASVDHYSKDEFTLFNYRNLLRVLIVFQILMLSQSQELHN